MGAAAALLTPWVQMMRIGMFLWFWQYRVPSSYIVLAMMMFLLYILVLSTTAQVYDDVLTAVFFLTLSSIFTMDLLYNYYDDLGINLNDYLYHTSERNEMHVNGLVSTKGFDRRWSFRT